MINLPIFERLEVRRYGLYPGTEKSEGLDINFHAGLTLVLGANGLGKSTLISIVYRMLSGPADIPGLAANRTELGNIDLESVDLPSARRRLFADRVVDGAIDADARLTLTIGDSVVVIRRRLTNLSLSEFTIDGVPQELREKESFQRRLAALVGLWSFGDWILLLQLLVFSFDQRRALVWDATAQRQILRLLFLPSDVAQKWSETERSILSLDSYVRNLGAVVFRQEQIMTSNLEKLQSAPDVRQELSTLESLQSVDNEKRTTLVDQQGEAEAERDRARLRQLQAEQERDTHYRELERLRLVAIGEHFPSSSQTARYVLAQLVTSGHCLACGHDVPAVAEQLALRLQRDRCVVCDSETRRPGTVVTAGHVAGRRYSRVLARVSEADTVVEEARGALSSAESVFRSIETTLLELNAHISERSRRIDRLVRMLPPEEAALHEQRSELATMRNNWERARRQLSEQRSHFRGFVETQNRTMATYSEKVKTAFNRYAHGFLFERCRLIWSPQPLRLGQGGETIDFPAFNVEMTSAVFHSLVRRQRSDEVSQSQREFIDLAFRMALIAVAGRESVGSLVVDAPESSLDGVFSERAANVLLRFAKAGKNNRLLATSNLVDGDLIPNLIGRRERGDHKATSVIDLFEIAEPGAAVRENAEEYAALKRRLFRRARALR